MSTTSYMGLSLPVPTVTIGPEWASQLNLALTAVDAHDHSLGKGPKITPLGLNINADLTIGGNNLTAVRSARLSNNDTLLQDAGDLRSVYVYANDLYYNNEAGNPVQLTEGNYIYGPSIGAFTANSVITTDNLGLFTASIGAANEVLTTNGTPEPEWKLLTNANIDAAAAVAYSKLNLVGSIVNADVNAAAAIAYSKLSLANSIVNADINSSAAIVYSKLSLADSIVNADVNSSAAIAYSKLNLASSIVNADVSGAAAIAYSKLDLSGSILNADVNAAAAIAYSKLNLSTSIVNSDINASAAIAYSKLNLAGAIVNADVSASAAIAYSKLNLASSVSLTTDITGTLGIANGGTGQVTANAALNALLPTQASANQKFLRSNGTDTSWEPAGAGGGSKNYLGTVNGVNHNGDFELGATTEWSAFETTMTGVVPTGSIGAASGAVNYFAVETPSLVSGTYSLRTGWDNSAGTVGDGFISSAFTIDASDKARVMSWSFNYFKNNAVGNHSGTSSNTWAVYIYDVTNSAWIQPAGVYSMTSGGAGRASGTFQTTSNSTQYRLAVLCINAPGGAADISFDDFTLGPQTAPIGPVVTDWESWTPTGSWSTNTTYTGRRRRVGDSEEYEVKVAVAGAPTSANLTVNLPSGRTIDTSKLADTTANVGWLGKGTVLDSGTAIFDVEVVYSTTTAVSVQGIGVGGTWANIGSVTQAVPMTFANGDFVDIRFKVPIVGWSSNVQMSNDTDTRVVAVTLTGSGTSVTSSGVAIVPTTISKDTHGAFSGSTFTCPVTGFYEAEAFFSGGSVAQTAGQSVDLGYKINGGSTVLFGRVRVQTSITNVFSPNGAVTVFLNAGDTFQFYGVADVTQTISAFNGSLKRVTGPAVVAATESVNCRYTNTAGTNIGTSATLVPYATKSFDSHNAWTGTQYNVPVSGKFNVSATILTATISFSTSSFIIADLYKNGVFYSRLSNLLGNGATTSYILNGSDDIDCVAGDYLQIYATASATTAMNTNAGMNHLQIKRVGN